LENSSVAGAFVHPASQKEAARHASNVLCIDAAISVA
jgi:hypothetical protein